MTTRAPRVLALTAAAALAAACSSTSGGKATGHTTPTTRVVITTARVGWHLQAPISRLVALPEGNDALLLGGLEGSGASSDAVYRLNLTTGNLRFLATMPTAFHDAAGAMIGGRAVVFGGGAATSSAAVQSFDPSTKSSATLSHLPQARSDLSVVTSAGRTYVLGGYTGASLPAGVLATTDGRHFRTVAQLVVPVRYAAVAAVGTTLWVVGGLPATTSSAPPTTAIQKVDLTTGKTTVVGHLPTGRADATAVVVGGRILIAGGRDAAGATLDSVDEFDPATASLHQVARLPQPVADAGSVVVGDTAYLIGGERARQVATVESIAVRTITVRPPRPSPTSTGTPAAISDQHPFNGQLLIADRGNNRLVVVDAAKHLLWHFPNASAPAPPTGFYFPDDAFFIHHGTGIISNQEGNDTIVEVGYPSGLPLWSYGHPKQASAKPGYLHEPDDAYLLRNGQVVVADANNCRVVFVSPKARQLSQIGTPGDCAHQPPKALGYPNGDTPLADGNILISEVLGSWISEYTPGGHLVWTVQLPSVRYPSDPQQIGPDRYLVADYSKPGGLVEFNRAGRILWRYEPTSGPGMLNHPSLAEVLPGGLICTNDDYRDRVVIIDPRIKQIVWQYGHTNHKGTAYGYLNTPDGFDLLEPDGSTPTHPYTG